MEGQIGEDITKRLILVRHGETDWNRDHVYRGHVNVPLNGIGRSQAQVAAEALRDVGADRIVTSPLSRAMDTAHQISWTTHQEVEVEDALTDIDYGAWEGKLEEQVLEQWPKLVNRWRSSPEDVEFPEGESLKEVQKRALAAVEKLADDPDNEVAVVVTHRVVLKALVLGLLRKNLKEFWKVRFANGSLTELELEEGEWRPVRFNDVEHLEGVGTLKDDF